jgi:hypothetical protein
VTGGAVVIKEGGTVGSLREGYGEKKRQHRDGRPLQARVKPPGTTKARKHEGRTKKIVFSWSD